MVSMHLYGQDLRPALVGDLGSGMALPSSAAAAAASAAVAAAAVVAVTAVAAVAVVVGKASGVAVVVGAASVSAHVAAAAAEVSATTQLPGSIEAAGTHGRRRRTPCPARSLP